MCRNIRTLFNFEPPATDEEIRASALQFVRKRLGDVGQDIVPREQQTPDALAAYYKSETDTWWPIIKAAGIKAE